MALQTRYHHSAIDRLPTMINLCFNCPVHHAGDVSASAPVKLSGNTSIASKSARVACALILMASLLSCTTASSSHYGVISPLSSSHIDIEHVNVYKEIPHVGVVARNTQVEDHDHDDDGDHEDLNNEDVM